MDDLESIWEAVRDDIPESFWKNCVMWDKNGGFVTGSLDVADRKRIGMRILEEVARRNG